MSRVTSRSRKITRPGWTVGDDLPRELGDDEYTAARISQLDVDDADEYLFFTVPRSPWTGGNGGHKTKVWRPMDSGSGSISGGSDNERLGRAGGSNVTGVNGSSYRRLAATEQSKLSADRHGSNTPTTGRGRVDTTTKLTSTGQSPTSPLSPSSTYLSTALSRPSAIPVRVTPNSSMFSLCLAIACSVHGALGIIILGLVECMRCEVSRPMIP